MKRSLIITIGILIILAIMGMWGYLMLYGAPKETREVFTNLGFSSKGNIPTRVIDVENIQNQGTNLSLTGSALQQLSTRAVAGFGFVEDSDTKIRYVEKGTGHLYEINTKESTENQISLTTIPKIAEAVFSPDGETVVLTSYEGYEKKVTLGTLDKKNQSLSLVTLPQNAENISFLNDKILYFSVENSVGTKGYSYAISSLAQTEVFTLTLTNLIVSWGDGQSGITIETKPTASQEGYAYTISKNILTPKKAKGYGLSILSDKTRTIASTIEDTVYVSTLYGTASETKQPILMLKKKCVFDSTNDDVVWCASPLAPPSASYLENWYKGTITSEDYLWYVDLSSQSAQLILDFKKLSGKVIDVASMGSTEDGRSLIFTNKVDQTLWMYKVVGSEFSN